MPVNYSSHFNTKRTAQNQPIPGKTMVKNNAGGFVFELDKFSALTRFLILGCEGGSYYVGEQAMTVENAKNTIDCIKEDGIKVVQAIVQISEAGRAPKNDSAIFALALCATFGHDGTKYLAYDAIPKVCRTGTHLFQFATYIQALRGWSRGLRNGVSKFYLNKSIDNLALQLVKYRQRGGFTHRDVLRLAHPKTNDPARNQLLKFAVGKSNGEPVHPTIDAYERLAKLSGSDVKEAVTLISEFSLPREAVPTGLLNSKDVWAALNNNMPLTATIRNLGKMTSVGLLQHNLSTDAKKVVERLSDKDYIKQSRLHPLAILNALGTYAKGQGDKGSLTWMPVPVIVDALNEAFYLAFDNIEPTNKNYLLALDCSGSMASKISGMNITCAQAAGALAMASLKSEPYTLPMYFSSNGNYMNREIDTLNISKQQRLDKVVSTMLSKTWGGTDCSLPMIYAKENKIDVDAFVVYTDNDTWAGRVHPCQALEDYRQVSGKDAKLIVVGMIASKFTIANPNDPGMLDVVGFDTTTPSVISEFARGNI